MSDSSVTPDRPAYPLTVTEGDVVLTLAPDQLYVEFIEATTRSDTAALLGRYELEPVLQEADTLDGASRPLSGWVKSTDERDLAAVIGELRADDRVRIASPVYHRADLLPMVTGHTFADEALVRFMPRASDAEARRLAADLNTEILEVFPDPLEGMLFHVRLREPDQEVFAIAEAFARSPLVRRARPNWIQLQSPLTAVLPNDHHFPRQWNLYRIQAPAGWEVSQGDSSVIIAIIDSGCDLTHPDLANQYVPLDDRYDAINNTQTPDDVDGHGTLVAGVAAAETNNGIGVAGVAPYCQIMPIRLFSNAGMTEARIISSIDWARTHGAHVINMSWYYTGTHVDADVALNRAHLAGLVLVAASGNCKKSDGCTSAAQVDWPASHPLVIAVGATDLNDQRKQKVTTETDPWDSRYGPELSVMAPSPIPWTTSDGGGYGDFWGTSAAAPQVAGLAALLVSVIESPWITLPNDPTSPWQGSLVPWALPSWRSDLVRFIIEGTAVKVGGYAYANEAGHPNGTWHEEMGYGRIDMARALTYARDNYTTYKLERPSSAYAVSVQILLGLIGGGPGVVLPPGGPPVPVDPAWLSLAPETQDVLLGLAITQLAQGINDLDARQVLNREGWAAVEQIARRMGSGADG